MDPNSKFCWVRFAKCTSRVAHTVLHKNSIQTAHQKSKKWANKMTPKWFIPYLCFGFDDKPGSVCADSDIIARQTIYFWHTVLYSNVDVASIWIFFFFIVLLGYVVRLTIVSEFVHTRANRGCPMIGWLVCCGESGRMQVLSNHWMWSADGEMVCENVFFFWILCGILLCCELCELVVDQRIFVF